jgi:hypothetical protein
MSTFLVSGTTFQVDLDELYRLDTFFVTFQKFLDREKERARATERERVRERETDRDTERDGRKRKRERDAPTRMNHRIY